MSRFKKATREKAKARVALEGPAGSGKSYSALAIATSLGDRIAVIDTEAGSASKYAGGNPFDFDVDTPESYDPNQLIDSINDAAAEGYDVIIIDSLSHYWMGEDGMLEQVDRAAKRSGGGNTFAGWKDVSPTERRMISAMIKAPLHVIVTMRTRTEWVIEENDRGKKVPRKIGLKPVQREGIEFEFDVVGDLDIENNLTITKSRCPELSGQIIRKPDGNSLGGPLKDWLETGNDPVEAFLRIAFDPKSTLDGLRIAYSDASRRQLAGRMVTDEGGNDTTLGDLLIQRGKAAATAAETAAFDAEVGEPNGNGHEPSANGDGAAGDGSGAAAAGDAALEPPPSDEPPVDAADSNGDPQTEPESEPEPDTPKRDTEKERLTKRMFVLFHEQGITDEEQQRVGIGNVIGRHDVSRGRLTVKELKQVIGTLENRPKPDAAQAETAPEPEAVAS